MTALIVMLPLIVVVEISLQLHRSFYFVWSLFLFHDSDRFDNSMLFFSCKSMVWFWNQHSASCAILDRVLKKVSALMHEAIHMKKTDMPDKTLSQLRKVFCSICK
jgi:hypothetical protein